MAESYEELKQQERYLLEKMEATHQIKKENEHAKEDSGKVFVRQEIPKMQLIENLRLQLIQVKRKLKSL